MDANGNARIRLRSVRFKDGRGEVRVLPRKKSDSDLLHEQFDKFVPTMLRKFDCQVSGFAVVVWGRDGTTSSYTQTDGLIPGILVPDLVRNKLLAQRIEDWTIDTVKGV